ncbi:MAG: hypothetical protein KGJ43_02415 [Acidobacteriota bacterium]|nr:hypothetical protein [Acidobacteriota bacterium]
MASIDAQSAAGTAARGLAALERHPHARAMLGPVLRSGRPAHAYLFHGPAGAGKRGAARALAAHMLAEGAPQDAEVLGRVERGTHPDLTWVRPSGASEMLAGDIDEAVVGAAGRTPFEAGRRVFVIDGAERMNEQAANRLLKTLEEPPPYAHLILVADAREGVMATIASRCQEVRFEALPVELIAEGLARDGVPPEEARACACLALGDRGLAGRLATEPGRALRADCERLLDAVARGELEGAPWTALLEGSREAGRGARAEVKSRVAGELELLPAKERRRHVREGEESERRAERRAGAAQLDLALRLAELALRDALCLAEGAAAVVYATDRRRWLEALVAGLRAELGSEGARRRLRLAVELVAETRRRMPLNVSAELALETLSYRLGALLRGA